MYDHNNYFYFYQVNPTSGDWSFTSYADKDGNTYRALQSIDPKGNKRGFEVRFSVRERIYRGAKAHKIWVEKNGANATKMSLYDYIKNYPEREGSDNYRGTTVFKELDEVKDAKVAISRRKLRLDAGNAIQSMDILERSELAPLFGLFDPNPDVIHRYLLEYADNDPEQVLAKIQDPSRTVRSLIRRGINAGVLKNQGKTIIFDKDVYGNEDDMVSVLLTDKVRLKALESLVKKLK